MFFLSVTKSPIDTIPAVLDVHNVTGYKESMDRDLHYSTLAYTHHRHIPAKVTCNEPIEPLILHESGYTIG